MTRRKSLSQRWEAWRKRHLESSHCDQCPHLALAGVRTVWMPGSWRWKRGRRPVIMDYRNGKRTVVERAYSWHKSYGPKPRVCDCCGCVHPDDALVLIRDHGWNLSCTTKTYKYYLRPRRRIEGVFTAPAKLYSWHLTQKQREDINTAMRLNKFKP